MEESVAKVSDMIVICDGVSVVGVLFKGGIENRKVFKDEGLMQLLFEEVIKPENLFLNLM